MSKKSTEEFIPLWTPHLHSIFPLLEVNSQAQELISNFQDWNGNGRYCIAVRKYFGDIPEVISNMRRGVEEVVQRKMCWGIGIWGRNHKDGGFAKELPLRRFEHIQDVVDRVLNVGKPTSCSRCSIISVMTSNGRVGFGGFMVVFMTVWNLVRVSQI